MPKKGISISSLLGQEDSKQNDDIVPITSAEMEAEKPHQRPKRGSTMDNVIEIDDKDGDSTGGGGGGDDEIEALTKNSFEAISPSQIKRTESGKIDIKSILSSNDNEMDPKQVELLKEQVKEEEAAEKDNEPAKPAPKKRKPRAAKNKKAEEEKEEKKEPAPKPKRAPRTTRKKAADAKKDEESATPAKATVKRARKTRTATQTDTEDPKQPDATPVKKDDAPQEKPEAASNQTPVEPESNVQAQQPQAEAPALIPTSTPVPAPVPTPDSSSTPNKAQPQQQKPDILNPIPLTAPPQESVPPQTQPPALHVTSHPSESSHIPYLQSQATYTPEPKPTKRNDIKNLMNNDDDYPPSTPPQLLPSPIPNIANNTNNNTNNNSTVINNTNTSTSATTTTHINNNDDKPKEPVKFVNSNNSAKPAAKPKQQKKAASNNTTNTDGKETKPKATKTGTKAANKKQASPQNKKQETPPVPLTQDQIQNMNLIKPDPKLNESLQPPKIVEISKSPEPGSSTPSASSEPVKTSTEPPIIALHVPLKPFKPDAASKDADVSGATQVVFNVLKMAEDKYGWKNLHPEASKLALDFMNDDDIDDDDEDDDEEDDAPPQPQAPIDGRRLQKGKPKIGQYDKEDPFIDDSEMVWEEQRASTKDGFFVFYGPLVEEGKSAKIERADGTIKRNRKRPAPSTAANNSNGNGNGNKKRTLAVKQTTPKLVPIAPASNSGPVDIAPKV